MIYFRKDRDCYVVSVEIGKTRIRKQAKTKAQAEQLERELLKDAPKEPERVSVVDAIKEYQGLRSKKKASGKSERKFFYMLDIFLDLKSVDYIDDVKPKHLEGLQQWLMQDHKFNSDRVKLHAAIKPSSVNRYFSTYGDFFGWCLDNEYIQKDPSSLVKQLPIVKPKRELVSDTEYKAALEICEEWFKPVLKFVYYTGMRPSSIDRLRWKHVEFERSRIVYTSRKGSDNTDVEKYFPLLMAEFVELLQGHKRRLIAKGAFYSPELPIFANKCGTPIRAQRISKKTNALLKRVGSQATLYGFRHKLVDDLMIAGVGLLQAGQLIGHSDIRTTQSYVHPLGMAVLNGHLETVRGEESFGADLAQAKEGVS